MDTKMVIRKLEYLAEAVPFRKENNILAFVKPYPLFQGNVVILDNKNITEITEENYKEINKKLIEIVTKLADSNKHPLIAIFLMVSSAYRIQFLQLITSDISRKELTEILSWIWTDTEFPNQYPEDSLIELFELADRNILMEEDDKKFFNNLPQKIKIYRGTQTSKAKVKALSWTLSEEKAKWFANRWKNNGGKVGGKVYTATINKEDIFAYFNNRQEEEIVVNPSKLLGVKELK